MASSPEVPVHTAPATTVSIPLATAPAMPRRAPGMHTVNIEQKGIAGDTTLFVEAAWQTDLERMRLHLAHPEQLKLAADLASGPVFERSISHALRWRLQRVGECWRRSSSAQTAEATVHLRVDEEGRVRRIALFASSGVDELDRCLLSVLRRLQLPRPPGDTVTLALPLSFRRRA